MTKTILVTGASSGIGKASAERLLADGHTVYVAARRLNKMKDLEERGAIALKLDITNEADINDVVSQIKAKDCRLDVLINNAGYAVYGAVEDTPLTEAKQQFEVNIFGLASLTQKVIPLMREKKSGAIINISSVGGKVYTPLGAWYHATKHALEGWSDCLRLEVQQFGINVIIIEPGAIKTEFNDVLYEPMIKRSAKGAYGDMVNGLVSAIKTSNTKPGAASPPTVIADVVSRAIRAKNPKNRYAAGKFSTMLLVARRWLSDRAFDKLILSTVK